MHFLEIRTPTAGSDEPRRVIHALPISVLARPAISLAASVPSARLLALWSGSCTELEHDDADAPEHPGTEPLFTPHLRNWSADAWTLLDEAIAAAVAQLPIGDGLLLRTHAAHILSDVPSCARFARELSPRHPRVHVLFDPASMLTPEMSGRHDRSDHLARLFAAASSDPIRTALAAVIVPPDATALAADLAPTLPRASPIHHLH